MLISLTGVQCNLMEHTFKHQWKDTEIQQLQQLRSEQRSWNEISEQLNMSKAMV